jgi:hypothetical protein
MTDYTSLEGPVELVNDKLVIRIPLSAGGDKLINCAGKIGRVEGNNLVVIIPFWLAEKLRISVGSMVFVDNKDNKFTITRSGSNDTIN